MEKDMRGLNKTIIWGLEGSRGTIKQEFESKI